MAGAGKSTFSRQLAARTSLPVVHLDLHSWKPGWVRVPKNQLLQKQRELLAADKWIIDSNDVDEDLLIERADTLVILATPWWICSWRAFRRGLRRPSDTQLPEGCEESLPQRLRDEWGIVFRNWRNRNSVPAQDLSLALRCPETLQVHILKSRHEIDSFTANLRT
jgi:adenylate kinase family enzyme